MLWDRQAALLAERMRDELRGSAQVIWPWDIHESAVRVHGSNIRLCLYFTPDINLVTVSAGRKSFAGITIQPMRWRPVLGAIDARESVRTLLRECVALMLLGLKRQAQHAGHTELAAQLELRMDKSFIRWDDEQSAGEAA